MTHRLLAAALCGLAIVPAATATASARSAPIAAVVRDCADGHLTRHYRTADLTRALRRLPTDVAEYSTCADLLTAQRARDAGRAGTGGARGALRECATRGTLRHRWPARVLRRALERRPSDVKGYRGCDAAILRAQLTGWTRPVWPRR